VQHGDDPFLRMCLQQAVNCEKGEAKVGFKEIKTEFSVRRDSSFLRELSNSFIELFQSLLFPGELTALICTSPDLLDQIFSRA